jgi:hypothetical protein
MNRIPTAGVHERVAEREEHPVPVVAREGDRTLVEYAHEAGVAALVRAVGPPVRVGGGQEQHVRALDELTAGGIDRVDQLALLEPVGEAARVELVLPAAGALVVEARHRNLAAGLPQAQSIGV